MAIKYKQIRIHKEVYDALKKVMGKKPFNWKIKELLRSINNVK